MKDGHEHPSAGIMLQGFTVAIDCEKRGKTIQDAQTYAQTRKHNPITARKNYTYI